MQQWSATNATLVLNELGERLALLGKLELLINSARPMRYTTFSPVQRGLWMFGPEYEAVDFRSNRGMAEVIGKFFSRPHEETSTRRPDFVALTFLHRRIRRRQLCGKRRGVWVQKSADRGTETWWIHDQAKEMDQARDYIKEIRAAGCIDKILALRLTSSVRLSKKVWKNQRMA